MQINSTNIQPQTTDYDLVGSSHMTIYVFHRRHFPRLF